MDDCPRCGSALERLELGEVETIACGRCGFADVPVDHESDRPRLESWRDALERFYER
ncbi:zf-TFIIB domain-containing protein [Natrononativus amylolyticus]|uniref:zf-TFIIB domain-containing protein n=1 Tax=Natrononativus amylolyticus TaxID=2963434 RepID=UPI0020CF9A25|nr:zf-TFIIB domain-containing protein [Natrononativus amylolyticus]